MINLGRFSIGLLAPAILGGFMLFWIVQRPAAALAVDVLRPRGDHRADHAELLRLGEEHARGGGLRQPGGRSGDDGPDPTHAASCSGSIFSNPVVWITALAYACTGVVRQGIDQWFPKYVEQAYSIDLKSPQFAMLVFGIPLVATLGSLVSGYVSDIFFKGRRAPVAAALYLMETVRHPRARRGSSTPNTVVLFLILIAFTANATHSILGTAAAMDIGGRKMAGFASGVIDSFQYYGGFLAGRAAGVHDRPITAGGATSTSWRRSA